ncbi:MAG: pseudouridine synthase [Candidatus Izemoplasmataceae bacterium]
MRLDKFLSNLKYGSRNDIKKLCKAGLIKVNDNPIKDSSMDIDPLTDRIFFMNEAVVYHEQLVLMMYKPKGYVSANKDALHKTVFDLLPDAYKRHDLSIAGRLDIDTEGLLILTNDGQLIHSIIHPKKDVYKTYYVETDAIITNIEDLLKPMSLLDGNQTPYDVHLPRILSVEGHKATIQIKEGKFHQVKNMFSHIGYEVTYLKRTAIHELVLDPNLEPGEVKVLNEVEIDKLHNVRYR